MMRNVVVEEAKKKDIKVEKNNISDENTNKKDCKREEPNSIRRHLKEVSEYLKLQNISKKVVTMAGAVLMLATLLGIRYQENGAILPTSASVQNRVLPIYCVQTDEPKIALTFDAAWADMRWMEL